jgi:signal transduction histidine kinase
MAETLSETESLEALSRKSARLEDSAREEIEIPPRGLVEISIALCATAWSVRRAAVERVREAFRALPKPPEQERLLALLEQAARDAKWEVRRAVAETLELLPDGPFTRLADLLGGDACHDVQSVVKRMRRRRREQVRADRRLQDELAQASSCLAQVRADLGPDVARRVESAAWDLFAATAGPVAHDINNTLTEEAGSIRRARAALAAGPEAARRFLEADLAERERRRRFIDALMDDLADFANPSKAPCERALISDVVRQALQAARQKLRDRPSVFIRQEIDLERGLAVEAPRPRLERALTNVIKNAFEAIEAKGVVRVTATTTDRRSRVVLRVADTGRGIDARDLERVFLPGVTTKHLDRQPGERKVHSGWGLAVARRFVERDCRGAIAVESVVGRGTTFTITLPVARAEEEA